jgi:Mlc titration factor MtfA (ptsG expression regulator)
MFNKIRNWRIRRIVARHPIAERPWQGALKRCNPARRLGASDQATLRVLATLFLDRKSLEPVTGLEPDEGGRVLLATHARVPILKLLDWYDGWHSIIVYPDAFIPHRQQVDAAGVVHQTNTPLAGEAWGRGPVILSWANVLNIAQKPGHNVVIHEMAHKLDMLNGDANGFPPMHRRMDRHVWWQVFSSTWDRLQEEHRKGVDLPIDRYGLESPAEFFAVASEQFFEAPAALLQHSPEVYRQLTQFYRQHPC